jgi:hypothetical protein
MDWLYHAAGWPAWVNECRQAGSRARACAGAALRVREPTTPARRAAVDPVAAKAIIGHTTDRMREHYSTVGADEARSIGERVVSLVPAVSRT